MTDKELLEQAAKAAGIEHEGWVEDYDDGRGGTGPGLLTWVPYINAFCWNPLTDDGDALRLAVKLGLTVDVLPWGTDARPWNKGKNDVATEPKGNDSYAATRRAIVRAAAEIGKSL